jgi:hypothetical protein
MPDNKHPKSPHKNIEAIGSTQTSYNPPDDSNDPIRNDADGHIIGGQRFGDRLTLAPFPQRNYLSLLKKGSTVPFEYTISGDMTTFTVTAKNAEKSIAITVTPRMFNKPAYYVSTPGATMPQGALSDQGDLNPYLERTLSQFDEYRIIKQNFSDLLDAAGKDLESYLTPAVLSQIDPITGSPVVLFRLGWGTVGRAVVWGLAGVAGALAAEAAAPAVFAVALLAGMSASAITEIWTAVEDAQSGGPDKDKKDKEQAPDMGMSTGSR